MKPDTLQVLVEIVKHDLGVMLMVVLLISVLAFLNMVIWLSYSAEWKDFKRSIVKGTRDGT